ncbi:MAG TPA: LysR family transcriptional regulator [Marinobacter sp.]|nr:LysR family transcriptional regulator [Marinobacter sp.]
MYDLQELEAFVSVVRTGSLTASTRDLGLPKSTLSRRIRQLEDAVGQPLLLRQSRRIVPNEAGRVFYRYSNDILELVAQGREALDELKEEVSGRLTLRCHEALVRGWFARLVESFLDQHQDLRVTVQTQRELPEKLDNGVCIWLGPAEVCNLRQELLGSLGQSVYGSPDYFQRHGRPQAPGDLDQHAWIDLSDAGGQGVVLQHSRLGAYPLPAPDRGYTVDQLCVQGDAIAAGRGLGLMPDWLVERRLQAHPGCVERCLPEWQGPEVQVSLIYPHGNLPRRVRAFISYVRTCAPVAWQNAVPAQPAEAVPRAGTHHLNT